MHQPSEDYELPCGCFKVTTYNDDSGTIDHIDEGWCPTHAEVIWPRILPGSRIIKHTENPQEAIDHDPEV